MFICFFVIFIRKPMHLLLQSTTDHIPHAAGKYQYNILIKFLIFKRLTLL